ncbi:hypothetical protein S40288_07584 [Stachybotrys chartarum IBT 40288]|nr:hypothetical protein S40288_07584 [Stachybotrys chartarum IBT 40288]
MAHQAHNIPWNLLASNLKWRLSNRCKKGATDFHWRQNPGQAKELSYFVTALVKNISEHTDCERKKFPENYEEPDTSDVVLSDDVCHRIIPTVRRWRSQGDAFPYNENSKVVICPHTDSKNCCSCPLPYKDRTMHAFLRVKDFSWCHELHVKNRLSFFNHEIFKTLLLYGEMDGLLGIYSHHSAGLRDWWEAHECQCEISSVGWDLVCKNALRAYILLNTIQCFPETWGPDHDRQRDYRNTRSYQFFIHDIARWTRNTQVAKYPHRQFFGIVDEQFSHGLELKKDLGKVYNGTYPYGRVPIQAFLCLSKDVGTLPLASDIPQVRSVLRRKGLPNEIVDKILDMTDDPKNIRLLPVEHDPFHPDNRVELEKYLKYCWQLLVRCELIARVIDFDLNWESMINEALVEVFCGDCICDGKRKAYEWKEDARQYRFI